MKNPLPTPLIGRPPRLVRLYHPRRDSWRVHFLFNGARIVPVTDEAAATVQVLQLNHPDRLRFRRALIKANRYPSAEALVDSLMVEAYWNVGRRIVEEEQQGEERAGYGTSLLHHLSIRLTGEFGAGFTERNLRNFRQFYLCFPIRHTLCAESPEPDATGIPDDSPIRHALRAESPTPDSTGIPGDSRNRGAVRPELSWTRCRLLIRVENETARQWYLREAAEQNWSSRALARQIHSLYYERLLSSKDKNPVIEEMRKKTASLAPSPRHFIRDPVVLEFLDIPVGTSGLRESRLEQAIIDKLRHFLLELGRGFAFVARQQRVSTETKDFFIALVFYHYILKCFFLIDLKMGELTHADIGQMDMYVRLYEDQHKGKGDNPTVGLILCTAKDQTVVKYSVLHESRQLFASQYQLHLPSEEELRLELERERGQVLREDAAAYGDEAKVGEVLAARGLFTEREEVEA